MAEAKQIVASTFVEAMQQAQGDRTLSRFAHDLGVDFSHLWRIYDGERVPGLKVLKALRRQHPELVPYIDLFLQGRIESGKASKPFN